MVRICVLGDVRGDYHTAFTKLNQVQEDMTKKGSPFDVCFCVGEFFCEEGADKYMGAKDKKSYKFLEGIVQISIPTYFVIGKIGSEKLGGEGEMELANNLTFLGTSGVKEIQGVAVAFLSGCHDAMISEAGCFASATAYTDASLIKLIREAGRVRNKVDVLLTSEWPDVLAKEIGLTGTGGKLGDTVEALAPAYHFSGLLGKYHPRSPYTHTNKTQAHATRFIGVGRVGTQQSWLRAYNLQPLREQTAAPEIPDGATASPFEAAQGQKRKRESETKEAQAAAEAESEALLKKRRGIWDRRGSGRCWFCLDQAELADRHLVVGYGDYSCLAVPKGALDNYHYLVVPYQHDVPSVDLEAAAQAEVRMWLGVLEQYYEEKGRRLFFSERWIPFNSETAYHTRHTLLQVYGILKQVPADVIWNAMVKAAKEKQLSVVMPALDANGGVLVQPEFFLATLHDGRKLACYPDKPNPRDPRSRRTNVAPPSFGRDALAALMGREKDSDWKHTATQGDDGKAMVRARLADLLTHSVAFSRFTKGRAREFLEGCGQGDCKKHLVHPDHEVQAEPSEGEGEEGSGSKVGQTALMAAASAAHAETCRQILDLGADANYGPQGSGTTPLHACVGSHLDEAEAVATFQALVKGGGNPNIKDAKGRTPLHTILSSADSMAAALIEAGADPTTLDEEGRQAWEVKEE